jgi:hypothetical protein
MGGMAPFIGDGKLSYKTEQVFEVYYSAISLQRFICFFRFSANQ